MQFQRRQQQSTARAAHRAAGWLFSKRGASMLDLFFIGFSISIGALLGVVLFGLLLVSGQREQELIQEMSTTVMGDAALSAFLRTPVSDTLATIDQDDPSMIALAAYLSARGIHTAQLVDLVGNKRQLAKLFSTTRHLPRSLQDMGEEELIELAEELLRTHLTMVFDAGSNSGWRAEIEYPTVYETGLEANKALYGFGTVGQTVATEARIPSMDGKNTIMIRLIRETTLPGERRTP